MSKYVMKIQKRCVACGACMKVCPRDAIIIKDGIRAIVDENLCVGCGLCMKTCPAGMIEKIERSTHE